MNNDKRPQVVVAELVSEIGLRLLGRSCEVLEAEGASRERLLELMAAAQGIVVRSGVRVDRELIEAAPELRVIGRAGVGLDNIDLEAAREAGAEVVNTPVANVISAAEHTMALMLAMCRNLPQADASVRAGEWDRARFRGVELYGKTLGVVGLGRIGSLVAERALAFGMSFLVYDPYLTPERVAGLGGAPSGGGGALGAVEGVVGECGAGGARVGGSGGEVIVRPRPEAGNPTFPASFRYSEKGDNIRRAAKGGQAVSGEGGRVCVCVIQAYPSPMPCPPW